MKKRILFLLAVLTAAVFCACSGTSDPNRERTPVPDPESESESAENPSEEDPEVSGCEGLSVSAYEDGCMITGPGVFAGGELVIPSRMDGKPVLRVDEDAFSHAAIVRLTVPWTVRWIGEDAFEECVNLETISLSEGLSVIGEGAFAGCAALKTVTVPSTVETVGRSAFRKCAGLEEAVFLGAPMVANYGFAGCDALKCVTFSGTLNIPYSVLSEAFSDDPALETVSFCEGLTEIGAYCFAGCRQIKTVILPKSLKTVGPSAFVDSAPEKVCYAGSAEDWSNITFGPDNDALKNATVQFHYGA